MAFKEADGNLREVKKAPLAIKRQKVYIRLRIEAAKRRLEELRKEQDDLEKQIQAHQRSLEGL